MRQLPPEILEIIWNYCSEDFETLRQCSMTCCGWHDALMPRFYRSLYLVFDFTTLSDAAKVKLASMLMSPAPANTRLDHPRNHIQVLKIQKAILPADLQSHERLEMLIRLPEFVTAFAPTLRSLSMLVDRRNHYELDEMLCDDTILKSQFPHLEQLHFDGFRPRLQKFVIEWTRNLSTTLTEISFSNTKIASDDICVAFGYPHYSNYLNFFDVYAQWGDEPVDKWKWDQKAVVVADLIQFKSLKSFNIRNCSTTEAGVAALISGPGCPKLETVTYSHCYNLVINGAMVDNLNTFRAKIHENFRRIQVIEIS